MLLLQCCCVPNNVCLFLAVGESHADSNCLHTCRNLSLMYHPDKVSADQKEVAKQLYEYVRNAIDVVG